MEAWTLVFSFIGGRRDKIGRLSLTLLSLASVVLLLSRRRPDLGSFLDKAASASIGLDNGKHGPLQVDLISIGTRNHPERQQVQQSTFATHVTVRNFYRINEANDTEAACATELTLDHLEQITSYCKSQDKLAAYPTMGAQFQRRFYSYNRFKNMGPVAGVGWMCAQKRSFDGLYSVLQRYTAGTDIPDYVIILDDDTYLNMDRVADFLPSRHPPHEPHAVAGCLIRHFGKNFTIPYGGWSTMLSRATIVNLLRPIHCQVDGQQREDFVTNVCQRIDDSGIGEGSLFVDSMSVADLMMSYVSKYQYADVAHWTGPGYCLHSDWLLGYFINYYELAMHTGHPKNPQREDRLHGYNGSQWKMSVGPAAWPRATVGECRHRDDQKCTFESHICHYVSPKRMQKVHDKMLAQAPDRYV